MGFRYRKSYKAGPFRLNVSKSGVGWSFGGKGYRYTKKANGGKRVTTSIPGTGMSWVKESSSKKRKSTQLKAQAKEQQRERNIYRNQKESIKNYPASIQKHFKILMITLIPLLIIFCIFPIVFVFPVIIYLGYLLWVLFITLKYRIIHRSEFK